MAEVCLLTGGYDYEGESILKVFSRKVTAENLMALCVSHHDCQPEHPAMPDVEYENKMIKLKEWLSKHPLGKSEVSYQNYWVYSYVVEEVSI